MQDTPGAEFVDGLDLSGIDVVIEKGQETLVESYSPFTDPWGLFPSKLGDVLVEKGITDVFVVGLGIYLCFPPFCGGLGDDSGGLLCQGDCVGCEGTGV